MAALTCASLILPVAFAACSATLAQTPPFPCPEPQWLAGDGVPGVGGAVRAFHHWDPDGPGPATPVMVVGGDFEVAGRARANSIAAWDPVSREWSNLGEGTDGPYSDGVFTIASLSSGELIIGGEFTTAGGAPANSVARWDGAQWHAMGAGFTWFSEDPGTVRALLALPNGEVIAGGYFSESGGTADLWFVGRWDGIAWTQFEHPARPTLNAGVHALALAPDGSLVAGGIFTASGGVPLNYVARWDGTAWQPLGSGLEGSLFIYPGVHALAITTRGEIIAAGDFTIANGAPVHNIALWDGAGWSDMAGGLGTQIGEFCHTLLTLPSGELLAGGTFETAGGMTATGLARWTGTEWSLPGPDFGNEVRALATLDDGALLVGGQFDHSFDGPMEGIAELPPAGEHWKPIGTGLGTDNFWSAGYVNAVIPLDNGDLIVGGDFVAVGTGANVPAVARWDGTPGGWHALGAGLQHQWLPELLEVGSMAMLPTGDLVVAGSFTHSGEVKLGNIARWDGTNWYSLGGGIAASPVYALAADAIGDVFAGGSFTSVGGIAANRVARWDGTAWWPLGGGVGNEHVESLAVTPAGDLIAGGSFTVAGGAPALRIARWDGVAWHKMGDGFSGSPNPQGSYVRALAVLPNGDVIAGGQFTSSGGTTLNSLARWDGTSWHAIGTSAAFTSVAALGALPNGDFVASGEYNPPSSPAQRWAGRWDGSVWHDLGISGEIGLAASFALSPTGDLIAGGRFLLAGASVSARVARLSCSTPVCYADCDASGALSIDDFICFQSDFALGDPTGKADCDGDGSLAIDDFICFQTAFALGC